MTRARTPSERKHEQYFENLVAEGERPPARPGGVAKDTIAKALGIIAFDQPDLIDVVACLLDTSFPSLLAKDSTLGLTLADGATTAHIGCYVGMYMRHGNKLDREGRDYWIKPLVQVGVIQLVTFRPERGLALRLN